MEPFRFEAAKNAQGLGVSFKATEGRRNFIECFFSVVPIGRMTDIMRQARRLNDVWVGAKILRQRAPYLCYLERVRQASANEIVRLRSDNLRFRPEPAQRAGMKDAGTVTFEVST